MNWIENGQTTMLATQYASSTSLTAQIPSSLLASPGTAQITVANPNGASSASFTFTITSPAPGAPTITSVTPSSATAGGGPFALNVSGTGFTSSAVVGWNSVGQPTTYVSATQLTAFISADLIASAGTAVIQVANPNGQLSNLVSFAINQAASSTGPVIKAVTNAATNLSGAISPGEFVVIYGSALGPPDLVQTRFDSTGSISTQLGGAQVLFNGTPAPMIYALATQVAAVVPFGITGTNAQVNVVYQGQGSAAVTVPITPSAPGLFTADSSGKGQVAALNQDGSVNGSNHPAAPGTYIVLFATGGGQTSPPQTDGSVSLSISPTLLTTSVTIGGILANVAYAGGAPGEVAGVMQVNAQIPSGVGGAFVPMTVKVGDAESPAGTTMAITGNAVGGIIQVSPASLSFSFQIGTSTPPTQTISVASSTGSTLTYVVSVTTAGGGAWLTANPQSGSTPGIISVGVNPAGLSAGSYQGTLAVGSARVPVILTVTSSSLGAGLQVVSGNNQVTSVNQPFPAPLVVKVIDTQGNPVAGTAVSFSGMALLSNTSAISNSSGLASTSVTAGPSPGTIAISASTAFTTVQFMLTVTGPSSGQTILKIGQTLNIAGHFDTSASSTSVLFSNGAGYQVSVTPLSVTSSSLSVLVPPYLDLQHAVIASGTVSASVIQQLTTGQSTTTLSGLQIGDLPQTGVSPGLITLDVLTQLAQLAGTANQTWTAIAQASGGAVNVSRLNLPALQTALNAAKVEVQALVSGTASQFSLAPVGGKNLYLDLNSLALLDRMFFAYYLGSTASPAQTNLAFNASLPASPRQAGDDPVTEFHNWFAGLIKDTLPQDIASNAKRLRAGATVAFAVAALVLAPGEVAVATAGAVAGFVWLAATWGSAATTFAFEGAGTEILNQRPADFPDFRNTAGIIWDAYKEQVGPESQADKILTEGGGEAGEIMSHVIETVEGVGTAFNPDDGNSIPSETEASASLLNSSNPYIAGSWSGSYSFKAGCGAQFFGQFSLCLQYVGNSRTSVSGNGTLTNFQFFDSNCRLLKTENGAGQLFSGTIGTDGHLVGYFDPQFPDGDSRSYYFDATFSFDPGSLTMNGKLGGPGTYSDSGSGTFVLSQ